MKVKGRNQAMLLHHALLLVSSIFGITSASSSCLQQPCLRKMTRNGMTMRRMTPSLWLADHARGNCFSDGSSVCYVTCDAKPSGIALASLSEASGDRSLFYAYLSAADTPLNSTYWKIPGTLRSDEVAFDPVNWLVYWSQSSTQSSNITLKRSDLWGNTDILLESNWKLIFALDVETQCLFYTPVHATERVHGVSTIRVMSLVPTNESSCDTNLWGVASRLKQRWLALHVDNSTMDKKVLIGVAPNWVALFSLGEGSYKLRKNEPAIGVASVTIINEADSTIYYTRDTTIFYVTYSYTSGDRTPQQLQNYEGRKEVISMASYGPYLYAVISRNDTRSELCMIDTRNKDSISMTTSLKLRYGQLELDSHTQLNMFEIS